jgi:hypothetical protein
MSHETLTDPLLGTLTRNHETEWVGRVRLTPKHEVKVYFDQWDRDVDDLPARLAQGREGYARLRRREWEHRRSAATWLLEMHGDEWAGGQRPAPDDLARRLLLVLIELFDDRSAALTYQPPPPFGDREVWCTLDFDGDFDGAGIAPRAKR